MLTFSARGTRRKGDKSQNGASDLDDVDISAILGPRSDKVSYNVQEWDSIVNTLHRIFDLPGDYSQHLSFMSVS